MTTYNHTQIASNASGVPATVNNPLGELDAAIGVDKSAAAAPTANDDENDGHRVGNTWYDSAGDAVYILKDATAGAAVWVIIETLASREWEELTISTDAVTLGTGSYYTIDTEGDASNDNLATINGSTDGKILYLRGEISSRIVTMTETGNLTMPEGMGSMELSADRIVMLVYDDDDSKWYVNQPQHGLKMPETGEYTIATGAITIIPGAGVVDVDTESDAATDDLQTINGGFPGMMVTLRLENAARVVTLIDNTGNLNLGGHDLEFAPTRDHLVTLWYDPGATEWVLHSSNMAYRQEFHRPLHTSNIVTYGANSIRFGRIRESSSGDYNNVVWTMPSTFVALDTITMLYVSTGSAVDWDLNYGYGATGEDMDNTVGSNQDQADTTAGTADFFYEFDITSYFSGVGAGDHCHFNGEGKGSGSVVDVGVAGLIIKYWERI